MRGSLQRWFILAIVVGLVLAACTSRRAAPPAAPAAPVSTVVPESGVTHNLRDRSGQVVAVRPGDLIALPLDGDRGNSYQWSFRSPVTGGFLTLKKHTVSQDARSQPPQIVSDWLFKVEKAGTFDLKLAYENPFSRQPPARVFAVKVFSDRPLDQVPALLLDAPQSSAEAAGVLTLTGYARASGTISYRLVAENQAVLASGTIAPPARDSAGTAFAAFEKSIRFSRPQLPGGRLEVSLSDGQGNVVVPVVFRLDLQTIQVYFANDRLDPDATCERVFAAPRYVQKNSDPLPAALAELLKGPRASELRDGYRTNLPAGVKLKSVELNGGTAAVDFSRALQRNVAGSCRVQAIRAQIEQTLKQFPAVAVVSIHVEGVATGILEP